MHIAIEAERANNPIKTGVEHYAAELIQNLAKLDQVNHYTLYLRTAPEQWLLNLPKNFTVKVLPFPLFWTQLRLSWEFLWNRPDILFIPASALPILHPKNSVVTIHDIAWEFFPETFTLGNRLFLKASTWFAVKFAKRIIAVSEATKQDLITKYGLSAEKISVVHHGVDPLENAQLTPKLKNLEKQAYLLALGTLQPRKNLVRLIHAFTKYKYENPDLDYKLIVAGKKGWLSEETQNEIDKHKDQIVYLGYVTDEERSWIFKNAKACIFPSLYEGFGIPVLEAFQAGVPLACSNISSLPEVAGSAAIYFDPKNINEIKNAISELINNQELTKKLVELGHNQLKAFSWNKTANETLTIFKEIFHD